MPVDHAVAVHGVAAQRAVIGFVVADNEIGVGTRALQEAAVRRARSLSQSTLACQGRGTPFQAGVKECSDMTSGALPSPPPTDAMVSITAR